MFSEILKIVTVITAIVVSTVIAMGHLTTVHGEEIGTVLEGEDMSAPRPCRDKKRYGRASIVLGFEIVYPNAAQIEFDKSLVPEYLKAYNNYGENQTYFSGDEIMMWKTGDGAILAIVFRDGRSCSRIIVGVHLHILLLKQIAESGI